MPEIKLPVTFGEFIKNPLKALLYIFMVAIVGLFSYLVVKYEKQHKEDRVEIKECKTANYVQSVQHEQLRKEVLDARVEWSGIKAELETLKKLGLIK